MIRTITILITCLSVVVEALAQKKLVFRSGYEQSTFAAQFEGNEFDYFLSIDNSLEDGDITEMKSKFSGVVSALSQRKEKFKSDKSFLKYLFYKIHRKSLRSYRTHAIVSNTLDRGRYDCVTGSAIYALVLDELGYDFHIRELDYHIFIEVRLPSGLVVIESTDPISGFYSAPDEIQILMERFEVDVYDAVAYDFKHRSDNIVGLKELAGLQYYNEAVRYYNDHNFKEADIAVDKALHLYSSPRINEVSKMIKALANSASVAMANDD